jgi:hypothetical protein
MASTSGARVGPVVEVRIPTYKRNTLLLECLQSLVGQSWTNWKAKVFDDANDPQARELVGLIGDPRIEYVANASRLGAAGNLNQCFQTRPYYPQSAFACCLEDDNWFYPFALETNVRALQSCGGSILMRNQDVYRRTDVGVSPTGHTTLCSWFEESGFYKPIELAARTFFYTGISNGALFWSTDSLSDLQDPCRVVDPSLQEYIRCWQIRESVFVALDSALAFSDPELPTFRHYTRDKSFSRALQQGYQRLLAVYGDDLISIALKCAKGCGRVEILVNAVSNICTASAFSALTSLGLPVSSRHALRGALKRLIVQSPIEGWFPPCKD